MIKWLIIIPVAIAALVVGISLYLQPNDFIGCQDKPLAGSQKCEVVDAIVVLSGGNTNARTDEGIKLYKNGWSPTLIFSGAAQDKSGPSNAAAMRLRALDSGIPESAISIDELSETTEENAQNTQSIFDRKSLDRVMLVTSGYHQRRASLEFEKWAGAVTILNHPASDGRDWSFLWWLTPRGWWLAGGEIIKIIAFYATGAAK